MTATGAPNVFVKGKGTYHGSLEVRTSSNGLDAINVVELEDYVRGVVAKESPASWPIEALKAQAVAARSYAISTAAHGTFDVFDDTRSQAYGGVGAETAKTDQAVAATHLQVVLYRGKVAQTFFFSTSGGHTENNEFSSLGLRAAADPLPPRCRRPLRGRRRVPVRALEAEVLARPDELGDAGDWGCAASSATSWSRSAAPRRGSCRPTWSAAPARRRSTGRSSRPPSACRTPGRSSRRRNRRSSASAVRVGLDRDAVVGVPGPELVGGGAPDGEALGRPPVDLDVQQQIGDRAVEGVVLRPDRVGVDPGDEVLGRGADVAGDLRRPCP